MYNRSIDSKSIDVFKKRFAYGTLDNQAEDNQVIMSSTKVLVEIRVCKKKK